MLLEIRHQQQAYLLLSLGMGWAIYTPQFHIGLFMFAPISAQNYPFLVEFFETYLVAQSI
jgi:hypothetical protein